MKQKLCGKYLGDNDATCPQLTCIRKRGHEGLCDNVRGDQQPTRCFHFVANAEAMECATPGCPGINIYLVQRGHDTGPLSWSGVPCGCGKTTYTVEKPDEDRTTWQLSHDLWPDLEQMHCWAYPGGAFPT